MIALVSSCNFLLIWAGLNGSIFKEYCKVIVADEEEIHKLFCKIFGELLQGHGYSLNEILQKSEVKDGTGKDIVYLSLTTGLHKLCSIFIHQLNDSKKANWDRRKDVSTIKSKKRVFIAYLDSSC